MRDSAGWISYRFADGVERRWPDEPFPLGKHLYLQRNTPKGRWHIVLSRYRADAKWLSPRTFTEERVLWPYEKRYGPYPSLRAARVAYMVRRATLDTS